MPVSITIRRQQQHQSDNDLAVASAIALALHVRTMARHYGVIVILHSEHCCALLSWLEGLVSADKDYYAQHGEPLFSSHGLNFSQDPYWEESIAICAKYFEQFVPLQLWFEMELGDCSHTFFDTTVTTSTQSMSYPQPQQVWKAYNSLSKIGDMFSILVSTSTGSTYPRK